MQNFSFAPPNLGVGENKKNYVFVDEHNRHKRLKVMRACEGCRRRKIKCDAATTNAWPCAACVRLKLNCVPPTINYDRTHSAAAHVPGLERFLDFDNSSHSGDEEYPSHTSAPRDLEFGHSSGSTRLAQGSYSDSLDTFNTPTYSEGASNHYSYDASSEVPEKGFQEHNSFSTYDGPTLTSSDDASTTWNSGQYSVADLSSVLGEFKIEEDGVAPYISQQKKSLADAPALEEYEIRLPSTARGSGSTVRIPPELMPSEERCMEWFDIFFTNIHPYVPVISKPYFYQQWRTNRKSISPLLLEAIFACAGRMSDDPAQGAQWLALASKHENCFMDVPRLSTIQALLLLLKAREAAPTRGYYYRSWMTIKTIITMAKDLELHEHCTDHQNDRDCKSDPIECLIKTRIWQSTFIFEITVGGPQGRHDLGVDLETVEVNIQRPSPGLDASDYQISRQFTYLVRMVKQVRILNDIYRKLKPAKDWGSDPEITVLNQTVPRWLEDLPSDLQITFPEDNTPPWLPSHFVGNMHTYHHLLVIMLHRPQLLLSNSFSAGGSWKEHMSLCYASAKAMCRLQEGILQSFGLHGLLYMQRGINFVIYAVLTCTMIHLVGITSPDPDFNTDAKDYFTRHMRILEICTSAWPMPDMLRQIDALREAFSADTSKPFELKSSFPYGSPSTNLHLTPPQDANYQHLQFSRQTSHEQTAQAHFHSPMMTPPVTVDLDEQDTHIPPAPLSMMTNEQPESLSMPTNSTETDEAAWNPTRIFDQWTNAFGTPYSVVGTSPNPISQPSTPLYTPTSTESYDLPPLPDELQQQQSQYTVPPSIPPSSHMQHMPSRTTYTSAGPSFVTSTMWQDTVASTYDSNVLKRRWDAVSHFLTDSVQPKRSR